MVKQFLKIAGVSTEKQFLKKYPTEEAFFRAHPEAMHLVHQKMAYGGGMYKYGPGGPIMPGTLMPAVKQAVYDQSAAHGIPPLLARPADPVVGPVQPAQYAAAPSAPSYQGVSIVDMLNARDPSGQSSSKASRKALAESMGISNYTGTAEQNRQLIEGLGGKWDGSNLPVSSKKTASNKTTASGKTQGAPLPMSYKPGTHGVPLVSYNFDGTPTARQAAPLSDKDRRIAERKAAEDMNKHKTDKFTFPNGETKTYKDMNWKEKMYVAGRSLESEGRFNPDDEAWYDKINPINWITSAGGALGESFYNADKSGSAMPIVSAVAAPVAAGLGVGALNYFKPRYEPYTPPSRGQATGNKQLPSSPSAPRQLEGPAPVRELPAPKEPKGLPDPRFRLIRNPATRGYAMGGEPCYECGGMYNHGGQTFNPGPGTNSGPNYFPYGGSYIPQPMMMAGDLPQYMYGMGMAEGGQMPQWLAERRFAAAGNQHKMSQYGYANGGLVKGSIHDMDEDQIQDLINQGYKIEYV